MFISNESCHDAIFVYTLIGKLVPLLKEVVPDLEMVDYWTDFPSSQYRNRTIFKIISCHKEYFGVTASSDFMEAGHGKRPCDPIGDVAKQKADWAVKNGKYVIQDAIDFFDWSKQDTSAIAFSYVSIGDYEISEKFLKAACEDLQAVKGTMKVHAIFLEKQIRFGSAIRHVFAKIVFSLKFQKDSCCKSWRECLLTSTKNQRKDESEKTLTKIKSHQELSLKIRNQKVLFPNLATMWQPFI